MAYAVVLIRAMMGGVFAWSGADKLFHPAPLAGLIQSRGYKISSPVVALAGGCEIVGALSLVTGWWLPVSTLALAIFVTAANFMVNDFWSFKGMDAVQAKQRFIPGIGMAIGLFGMFAQSAISSSIYTIIPR